MSNRAAERVTDNKIDSGGHTSEMSTSCQWMTWTSTLLSSSAGVQKDSDPPDLSNIDVSAQLFLERKLGRHISKDRVLFLSMMGSPHLDWNGQVQ